MSYNRITKMKSTPENTKIVYDEDGFTIMSKELVDMLLQDHNCLWELENQIENGTLRYVPCKVGDTVFVLREDCFLEDNCKIMWHIAEGFVKKIYINKKNEIFLQIISWVDHKSWSKDSRNYKVTTFGKSVFFDKDEAEKKLEELQKTP